MAQHTLVIALALIVRAADQDFEICFVASVLKMPGDQTVVWYADIRHEQADDVSCIALRAKCFGVRAHKRSGARAPLDEALGSQQFQGLPRSAITCLPKLGQLLGRPEPLTR